MIDIPVDKREKVLPPGKYKDMSNEDYHSDKHYFSSSQLKEALNSPAHFKYYVMDKNSKKKSTPAMDRGTLVHTIVLEPYKFDYEYRIHAGDLTPTGLIPAASQRAHDKEYPGIKLITQDDYDFAKRARDNFEQYPIANELLFDKGCEYEPSYFIHCEQTGLRLRVRPDCINIEKRYIVDLKTTRCKSKIEFAKDANYNFHYDLSAYMYVMAIYQATGVLCDFYWATVGTEDMCPTSIYKVSFDTMERGKGKFFKAIENIKTALTLPEQYRAQAELEEI